VNFMLMLLPVPGSDGRYRSSARIRPAVSARAYTMPQAARRVPAPTLPVAPWPAIVSLALP
jgi:hypothetical protein